MEVRSRSQVSPKSIQFYTVHLNAHSQQVTAISRQWFFSFARTQTETQTHIWTHAAKNNTFVSPVWLTRR